LFLIKQLVKWAVLPPTGPLLIAFAGLALGARYPRPGRLLTLAGVVMLALFAMPVVGGFLVSCLDRSPVLDVANARSAQAIVILGGGTRRYAPEYSGSTPSDITLERVRYGARLARATNLPVLVSGGAMHDVPAEALLMRDVLQNEFRVPVRWVEARSHNTHQNAVNSAAILKASSITRVILVGHSFDFPRTRNAFEAEGIDVIAAPIDLPVVAPYELGDFWPSARGLQLSRNACYEILANVLYRLTHGRAENAQRMPLPAGASTAR
jgi:uncharacterized SAM-binding protein YcdF (DUF218 family)